jgi:subtilisin family serine protease
VIDSGISPHPAFREGQITHLDLTAEGDALNAHGTAIASLVAGNLEGAEGLAPGADLLDIRIAGKEGLSDSFLLAQGIHAAIERGAGVINISMATYGDARPVAEAIAEANRRGITVIAAVGNDAAGIKAWPAAYPGVISVSGVDAEGHLAYFSNTGAPSIAAPSVGVPSAYHEGGQARLATGNGTSQATALVSGAAAAFRSRGLDAAEALIRNARPGSGKKEEIGAGVLFVPALGSYRGR